MKQIIVLEELESKGLQKGKMLLITTPGGAELGIQFSTNEFAHPSEGLVCDKCGATKTRSPSSAVAVIRSVHLRLAGSARNSSCF